MDKIQLKLPPQLDMAALANLKEELVRAAISTGNLTVDAAGVERVGTPAIQLLLAAAKAFSSQDRQFTLHDPSEALAAAFDDLGLADELRQWSSV